MDRTSSQKRLFLNTFLGLFDKFVICILGLVLRRIFLDNIGAEISGLSSLFQNIIEFLSLATAGLVTAIYPRLYQYNAENDYENIKKIMRITRQFYMFVSMFMFFMGVICSFRVDRMIYDNQYSLSFIRIVFLIQILSHCVRILSSPAVAMLSAREQGYYNIILDIIVNLYIYITQIFVVIISHSYILYLCVSLIGYFIYVVTLEIVVNHLYPWASSSVFSKPEKIVGLFGDMKFTIIMQIANFIFVSTDSIVISSRVGLKQVNAYGNYMTIATAILAIYTSIDAAVRNYFGNKLAVDDSVEEKESFMKNVTYIYFIIGLFCAIEYICLIEPFVSWWLGEAYVLSNTISVLFGLYIFMQILYNVSPEYLQILGIFRQDMVANISSAVVNLALSFVLIHYMGIAGVLFGTLIGLTMRFLQRTKSVYNNIGTGGGEYIKNIMYYSLVFVIALFVSVVCCRYIVIKNIYINFILKGCAVFIIFCVITCMFSFKKDEFKFMIVFIKNKINGGK